MAKKTIDLETQEELTIFMSPRRQELIRQMRMNINPMTPKAIADKLGISASSAQFHLKKLESLGLVKLDHRDVINGIVAKYYRLEDVNVSIGTEKGKGSGNERYAIMQNLVKGTLKGLFDFYDSGFTAEEVKDNSEFINGFINLNKEDAGKLMDMIREFVASHEKSAPNTEVWEYTLMFFNTGLEKSKNSDGGGNDDGK